MYSLLRKSKKLGLTMDLQLQLFDNLVTPIMLYGAEIWGCGNNEMLENLHMKYCRILLRVSNKTARCMVYGELGRLPLQKIIDQRILNYWCRLTQSNEGKLNKQLYRITYNLVNQKVLSSEWVLYVKHVLNKCGLYNCWIMQRMHITSVRAFTEVVDKKLLDVYESNWKDSVHNNRKCLNYRMFKRTLCFENYLVELPTPLRIAFTRFRLSNHNLPIEKGRYENVVRQERKCRYCKVIGDEYHYLFECYLFRDDRRLFLSKGYQKKVNIDQYNLLFSTKNYRKMCKIAQFVKIIMTELQG